jgi:hypothetical protein
MWHKPEHGKSTAILVLLSSLRQQEIVWAVQIQKQVILATLSAEKELTQH